MARARWAGVAPPATSRASRSWTSSGLAPTGVTRAGVPTASASAVDSPNPSSSWVGVTVRSAARYHFLRSSSLTRPSSRTWSPTPSATMRRSMSARRWPSPATASRAPGWRATTSGMASTSSVTPVRAVRRRAANRRGSASAAQAVLTRGPGLNQWVSMPPAIRQLVVALASDSSPSSSRMNRDSTTARLARDTTCRSAVRRPRTAVRWVAPGRA